VVLAILVIYLVVAVFHLVMAILAILWYLGLQVFSWGWT